MGVDLLKHNQEAYEKITEAIADGKKKIAIAHATGTGKSYLIAKLFEDYSNDKKLVLVPSTYISDQIKGLFEKYSIQNVDVILYQKLIKMSDEDIAAMDYDVVALDEYHHDTSKVWGERVRKLIDTHSNSIIFGASATPIRSDGINTIDELFEGNCASDLPLSESIAKKIVPLPKYVGALYTLDDELEKLRKKVENATNTKEEKQEFYKKINAMRSQIEKSYGMPIILNKHIRDKEGKYIIFCKNKRHLKEIMDTVIEWFKTAGCKNINSYIVHSSYENKDAEYKAFCDDTSHNLKLMFCIAVLNEGLHLENISGVLLLRPTRSSIVWHQQIGRAIEANNTNIPVIIDAVNNFRSAGQGMKLFKEIRGAVEKEKKSNPNFDDSGFEDIDTFFVIDQVVEIQEMFKEIEGRLEGDWDLYIKALKQYKEREGNCLVPARYIEIVDGEKVSLGRWIQSMRTAKEGRGRILLAKERKQELDKLDFIWDVNDYYFQKYIKALKQYKKREGNTFVPCRHIEILDDESTICLGNFVVRMRTERRKGLLLPEKIKQLDKLDFVWDIEKYIFEENLRSIKKFYTHNGRLPKKSYQGESNLAMFLQKERKDKKTNNYPVWKIELFNKYLPDFCWLNETEYSFYNFIKHAIQYKEINGHINIKQTDVMEDGYKIGKAYNKIIIKYNKNKLGREQTEKLQILNIRLENKNDVQFSEKFKLCEQAISENIIISSSNKMYKSVNLYCFIMGVVKYRYEKGLLNEYQEEVFSKLLGFSISQLGNRQLYKKIEVFDAENKRVGIFNSVHEASRNSENNFGIKISQTAIRNRLSNKIKGNYKGFTFKYVW